MNNPLVSVLMTAFNREKFISEAIESVLKSSYQNFELLIVDDCSSDNTVNIAKSYAILDNRIRIHLNENNLGDYSNRNNAASLAQGEFIMFVDSDDTINSDAIEYLVGLFNFNPQAEFSMIYYHDDISQPAIVKKEEILRKHFFQTWCLNVGPGGTFMRKNFFKRIGSYDTNFGPANDMFFNLKVCCYTDILIHPNKYLNYRRHDDQEINNEFKYICHNHSYLKNALGILDFPLSESEKKLIIKKSAFQNFKRIIIYLLRSKNVSKAIKALKSSQISIHDVL